MSTRVMLVNPPPHRRVDQYDEPDFGRSSLASLAAEVRAHQLGPVSIVDAKLERLSHRDVLERVRAFAPDVVGLGAMTNEVLSAARVARSIKEISPSITTVLGGTHVSVRPEETLQEMPEIDHGVIGEGEITFRELMEVLARSESPTSVEGVVTRLEGKTVRAPPRPRVKDLDTLRDPAWDLLPPTRRYLVSTQKGCPYHCSFCVNPNGTLVRRRSVERVVEEMKRIAGRGGRVLYICDELFSLDMERTHELLDAMIAAELPRRLKWTAATNVGFVDRDLLAKMRAAGCVLCEFGVETGDPKTMERLGKNLSEQRVLEVRREAAEVGLRFGALMILGHPGETKESARRTIDLAVRLNADQTIFGIMVPFPGTEVERMARGGEEGYRLIARDWNDYGKQHGHALELEGLTRRELETLQLSGYVEVLARNGRLADLLHFGWTFRREGLSIAKKLVWTRMGRGVWT